MKTSANLEKFAREHIAYEVRMYVTTRRLQGLARAPFLVDEIAYGLYESCLVHARLINEFLQCSGKKPSDVKACDYIDQWSPRPGEPKWLKAVNKEVAHLDIERTSGGTQNKLAEIHDDLRERLYDFYESLPIDKKNWFNFIPQYLGSNDAI